MTQSSRTWVPHGAEPGAEIAPGLSALVDRLRALSSAWRALAPSGLSAEKTDIATTGRTLNDDLMALIHHEPMQPDLAAYALIEARLDSLEAEMRAIAFRVPIPQLRSTLPECTSRDRRGVLDLLDLMLGAESLQHDGIETRIPSIDYVITLLCNAGAGRPPLDPVQLTPRLHELCERCSVDYDPRLPEIEAEFFHAADFYEADGRAGEQLLALQARKTELGSSYFSPQVLRAIVAYNVALLQRIDEEVLASQDWGALPPVADEAPPSVSVFDTEALPQIAQALRRRAAGEAPAMSPTDRIAWCLDLDYPTQDERTALLADSVGRSGNPAGTAILVGLLCRSAVVLEEEFPDVGITSALLFSEWAPELAEALQREVNRRISGDEYREACALSELKTRYLFASMAEVRRKHRGRPSAPPSETAETAASAKPLVREALARARDSRLEGALPIWKRWPLRRPGTLGAAIAGALLIFAMGWGLLRSGDLARFDRDQLDRVSPFLSYGARNQDGQGPAFVGRIRKGWSALEESDRLLVATDLVGTLREAGVRDVMIYDDTGTLRIQALGDQPPRVLPGRAQRPTP